MMFIVAGSIRFLVLKNNTHRASESTWYASTIVLFIFWQRKVSIFGDDQK